MKHFVYFKYGRIFWEKIYEYFGDLKTARDFQKSLTQSYGQVILLVEVI